MSVEHEGKREFRGWSTYAVRQIEDECQAEGCIAHRVEGSEFCAAHHVICPCCGDRKKVPGTEFCAECCVCLDCDNPTEAPGVLCLACVRLTEGGDR